MAVNTTPKNSWIVYTTGEQNQKQHPQYRLRSRYIKTKDYPPMMNYKQLEKALPPRYDLPFGETPMDGTENPPELLEATPELLEAELASVEESIQWTEEPEYRVSLTPETGSIGDEVSVEANWNLSEIIEVYVNGTYADFVCTSDTKLTFNIPDGATSGDVDLIDSSGRAIKVGSLRVNSD
jgi:hypothetical protein